MLLSNVSDLMGHQSVRATFRLSARFIEALSIVSSQLGLKHKSLFDHPLEDTESLMAIARSQPHQKDDPVPKFFAAAAGAGQCAFEDMEKLVKKGKRISNLQMEKFQSKRPSSSFSI